MKASVFVSLGLCSLWAAGSALGYDEVYSFTTPVGLPYVSAPPAGVADGTNNNAKFYGPAGMAMDGATNLYVVDGNVLRRISPVGSNWVMITLAGTATVHAGDDGTNGAAKFDSPQGIAADTLGNLFVADTGNNAIRKITAFGTNWVVTTIAGAGRFNPGSTDGTNTSARFNQPYGIATGSGGTLFVADTFNNTIRKLEPVGTNWLVTTIAGLAGSSGSANGTGSAARFSSPAALVLDTAGNIYVADYGNHTIRKIAPSLPNATVSTIAGLAGSSGSANGTNANARFNNPAGIAADNGGHLFVADSGSGTIRKLRASGTNWIVSTLAGSAGSFGNVDGVGTAARFDYPDGIAVDGGGTVYVTDNSAFTMRLGQVALLLQSSLSAEQLTISWPLAASNFVLETRSGVSSGPPWLPLTNGVVISADSYRWTTNATLPSAYFRLHKP